MNSLLVISLLLSLATDKTSEYVTQGMNLFRDGRVRESLTQFDRAIEIAPQVEPYLWQRGISQYCLGDYAAGRRQFELHQDVNPNDVENAAWHYFCVAKREGKKAAQKALLPINTEHDQRCSDETDLPIPCGRGDAGRCPASGDPREYTFGPHVCPSLFRAL